MEVVIDISDEKVTKAMIKVLEKPIERAFIKTVEYLFAKIYEASPSINSRAMIRFDHKKVGTLSWEGFIGWPEGSEVQLIANYTEFGTGERGSRTFKQFYGETKPVFTIPIVPLKKKTMHWKSKMGIDIFAKSTKGQPAQAWIRKAIKEAEPYIEKIWLYELKKI